MSADIICLYYDLANLTPIDPVFHYSPHLMTPFSKFQRKISNLFCVNFQLKRRICCSNLTKFTPNDPLLLAVHTKKAHFLLRNPTPNTLCFHYPVGTNPSLSYLSPPPPPRHGSSISIRKMFH